MSREALARLSERKALLVTRAELDRARMSLALHEIRGIVRPPMDPLRREQARSTAAMLVGFAVPLLGLSRVGRTLRIATFVLTAYRIARNWRGAR